LAPHDEQPPEEQSGPEATPPGEWLRRLAEHGTSEQEPLPPPSFAAGYVEDAPEVPQSAPPAQDSVTEARSVLDAGIDDSRRQLREQAERAVSSVQQILLNENERLRTELTAAIGRVEERLREGARSRTDAEIERMRATSDQTVEQVKAAVSAQLATVEERLRATLEENTAQTTQAEVARAMPRMQSELEQALTARGRRRQMRRSASKSTSVCPPPSSSSTEMLAYSLEARFARQRADFARRSRSSSRLPSRSS
jgi:hypothetical protein